MDLLVFIQAVIYLFKVVTNAHCAAFEHVNIDRDVQIIYETDTELFPRRTFSTQSHSHWYTAKIN